MDTKKLANQFETKLSEKAGQPRAFISPEDLTNLKGKPIYSAVFLTPESKQQLINWVKQTMNGELLAKPFAHHMTIQFKPPGVNVPVGKLVNLKVVGWNADDKCQAVAVECPTELGCANAVPHVTVSCGPEGSPKDSNELLAREVKPASGPVLQGVVGVFGGEKG